MKRAGVFFWLLTGYVVFFLHSAAIHAESDLLYGPRLEFGPGVGITSENAKVPWASESYQVGMLTAAVRLFKGLSVQGGIEYGRGKKSDVDSLSYGNYRLQLNNKTYTSSMWAGVRYELPMNIFRKDIMGIHSVYGAAGMCWADYGVKSTEWTNKGVNEQSDRAVQYRTARLSGPYYVLAARWRIDSPDTEGLGSWIGSYGVDLGVRYTTFGTSRMEHPNIVTPPDDFSSFRVFVVGFMKFRLFE
jgi:hypothetical protein